jgi:small subunit ribosomal protein S2
MKDLLEAGVHFGHQTKRWNPKMKEYIFGERKRHLHHRSQQDGEEVPGRRRVRHQPRRGRKDGPLRRHQAPGAGRHGRRSAEVRNVLRQPALARRPAHELHDNPAQSRTPFAIWKRWSPTGRYDTLSKKEIARNEKEKRKLLKNLEGIRHMSRLPDAIFVVDTRKEKIAVDEARKLKIPVHRRGRYELRS